MSDKIDKADLLESVRWELQNRAAAKAKIAAQQFFKEEIRSYGVRIPVVHEISKVYYADLKEMSKHDVFDLCEALWASGILEESIVACNWSMRKKREFEISDLATFERWVSAYVNNWASCDTLCNHTIGTVVEKFPDLTGRLITWAASPNRWMRRAAAVTLIVPARKGLLLEDIFQICDLLLVDEDDLVQKGYGWLLKSAASCNEEAVFDYVMANRERMPRTALRYAVEKMPIHLKSSAMEKVKS